MPESFDALDRQLRADSNDDRLVGGSTPRQWAEGIGGNGLQPVLLVLLVLGGPRQGENDFLEFPSIDEAVAYGREMQSGDGFQLEAIEDANGKILVCFDDLNDRCRMPDAWPERRFG